METVEEKAMAKVKIESVIEHLNSDMRRALEDAVNRTILDADFDRNVLFREFVRAVGRKCPTWTNVPDSCVRLQ